MITLHVSPAPRFALEMTSMAFGIRRSNRGLRAGIAQFCTCQCPIVYAPNCRLCPVLDLDLAQDRLDVDLHRRLGDIHLSGYAFVGVAFDQAAQN